MKRLQGIQLLRLYGYHNSVNVLTGIQGVGKTFTALNEILTISSSPPNLSRIKKKDHDPSALENVESSVVGVLITDYSEAEDAVAETIKHKFVHNDLKRMQRDNEWSDDEIYGYAQKYEATFDIFKTYFFLAIRPTN
jgi:hypothetical protein